MNDGAIRRAAALVALVVLAAFAVGCGEDEYQNRAKAPAVITVSVFVGEDRLAYSPRNFGAGPAQFIIANQTGAEQNVTLSTDRLEREVRVAAQQTAKLTQTLEPGFLQIEADNSAGDPLEVEVGPARDSAQQDLDQP